MLVSDPCILYSMLEDRDRRIADLEHLLVETRAHALKWEHEAKALRKEVMRLRMECDTEVLHTLK